MTRTTHFNVGSKIPVYALTFLDDHHLIYAGGGGAGRSGVSNAIRSVKINLKNQTIQELNELALSRDQDAPMALDLDLKSLTLVAGINQEEDRVRKGENQLLRLFKVEFNQNQTQNQEQEQEQKDDSLQAEQENGDGDGDGEKKRSQQSNAAKIDVSFLKASDSIDITDPEQYVKVIRFSKDARMLVVGSTDGRLALHRFPSLEGVWKPPSNSISNPDSNSNSTKFIPDFQNEEIYDADFSEDSRLVVVASSNKLKVYDTSSPSTSSEITNSSPSKGVEDSSNALSSSLERNGIPAALQTIQNPALGNSGPCTFRSARFGKGDPEKSGTRDKLFTVVNSKTASNKGKVRKSFLSCWDSDTWELVETRNISDKPVTAFDVSADGKLLAYGSSDLSVGVLDAVTLRPILRILHAHSFPPTCLKFSPSGSILISASADNTLRIIEIPENWKKFNSDSLVLKFKQVADGRLVIGMLSFFLVFLAWYLQTSLNSGLKRGGIDATVAGS